MTKDSFRPYWLNAMQTSQLLDMYTIYKISHYKECYSDVITMHLRFNLSVAVTYSSLSSSITQEQALL